MKKLALAVGMLVLTTSAFARERAAGYCNQGGHVVITQGLQSTNDVQESYPSCTVTVYINGTTTLAAIYADNLGTVKGNPFTSDANGYWFFYANNGRYDVHFSNSDIVNPYTQGDYLLCDPADSTGIFSCGGGGGGGNHNLLSTTHLDTIPASPPTRGALITGQNLTSPSGVTPAWAELTLGPNTYVLTSNGTDAIWAPVPGGGGCLAGASNTRYVDSTSGSDSNSGLNWCSAYATEQTAVTALTASGGWVYEAPNYSGASAASVPANIHILRTAQTDSHQATSERLSFLDQTNININTLAQFLGIHSTTADAVASWTANNAFRSSNLQSGFTSMLTTTGTGIFGMDTPAVLGIANMEFLSDQAEGVEGICAINGDNDNSQDCTGVVAVAADQSGSVGASSMEGVWSEIRTRQNLPVNNVDAYVARLAGGGTPPGSSGGLFTAAFDIRTPYTSVTLNDLWPNGMYMEDGTTTQPVYLGIGALYDGTQRTHLADWGNNGIEFGYWYDNSVASISQIRVAGSGNVLFPFGGDFQFINQHANGTASTTTVSLQTNATGNLKVEAINAVAFSATPTFDRSLGSVQKITLTANVTSATFSNCLAGQTVIFDIVEDGTGGHTFTPPANLHLFGAIDTTANSHNVQTFYCDGTSTLSGGYATGVMVSGL